MVTIQRGKLRTLGRADIMKTKKLASLLAIVSMLVIVAMSWMPSASAWETEGTETIDEDSYWYQTITFFNGDYFTLSYTIDVQNDQYIDVMLLNEENFNKYKNEQSFTYYSEGTDFNTLYKNVPSITFYTHDNYYLVVDNTDNPPGGAQPAWDGVNNYCTFHYTTSGEAHYYNTGGGSTTTDNEDFFLLGIVCISFVIIGIVVAVLVGVLLYNKQKKQRSEQPPQQPPQPYYRGQQQPPPPPDYRPPQPPY